MCATLYVDAGVKNLRARACAENGRVLFDLLVPSACNIKTMLQTQHPQYRVGTGGATTAIVTGKLASTVCRNLGCGRPVLPGAAFWLAARELMALPENASLSSLAIIDLSASGYLLLGIDRSGALKDDLLVVNPRCGAGCGMNLDRALQKLGLGHEDVDPLLASYLGDDGSERRRSVATRADRCGVFSCSATVSDKNQGIPLDVALACTLKSEVYKACKRLPPGFDRVYLTGRVFRWRYARECAQDLLRERGAGSFCADTENTQVLKSLGSLVRKIGYDNLVEPDPRLMRRSPAQQYPSFSEIKARYEPSGHFKRLPPETLSVHSSEEMTHSPSFLGLDVGSTMAKVVLVHAASGDVFFIGAYSNAGDTIETVKKIFRDLLQSGVDELSLRGVGITGSARYQVQQALAHVYPGLADRIVTLVENYAHARGSIQQVRDHIRWLHDQGIGPVNEDFCTLVDIGGEDTKISTIVLRQAELFDNAMNVKCSAGTGSLMDTLSALFSIDTTAEACARAYRAPRSFAINATCAVFLMENASRLQAEGVPEEQILASANWAIVENMARTLWEQLELPRNAVVLLQGQTMLSDPLPLAVTHRLRSYLGSEVYALVPPNPGHRACMGLIKTLGQTAPESALEVRLEKLLNARFEKRVIECKGAACGDPMARCNRCALRSRGDDGARIAFTLGGCTAINELLARKGRQKIQPPRDAYGEIWAFIAGRHPTSDDPRRLVIPRSFAVTEWAYFLSRVFAGLGIPVHVDDVRDQDLVDAQPHFNVDTCAPLMGAVGQYRRLAGEAHGIILGVQIEALPTGGKSAGLTCTTNQGGVAVARNLAQMAHPDARFHLVHLSLEELDAGLLCDQLYARLQPVFRFYGVTPGVEELQELILRALRDHRRLRSEAADLGATLAEEALQEGRRVALVVGREYVLNPGVYDSHIRRLLRDRQMTVIPSYVLDVGLDEDYGQIYWRNPHFIVTLLSAVAHRTLHCRLRHARMREVFRRIETDAQGAPLPVVQVSTFSCGPDSITAHYVAEIMKQRPFLLIQSDAVLKELAHLENRVNTYVKQLEGGLSGTCQWGNDGSVFEIRSLDDLVSRGALDRERDVLCFPTLSDNRFLSSVLKGAGFTCLENFDDDTYDLEALVRAGRKYAGEAVCAPLAGMYADFYRGVQAFVARRRAGDPALAGKQRLLLLDSRGTGPCRQGQYPDVHRLLAHRGRSRNGETGGCTALPGSQSFQFLIPTEDEGYDLGLEEWVVLKMYQGCILQGVLQEMLLTGAVRCRDFEDYRRFVTAFRRLKQDIFSGLESYHGPGPRARKWLKTLSGQPGALLAAKYFAYRLHGREFAAPLRRFVSDWIDTRTPPEPGLRVLISGEAYMRVSQAEAILGVLLGTLGFRRFSVEVTPLMAYLEYLLDEAYQKNLTAMEVARAGRRRCGRRQIERNGNDPIAARQRTLRNIRALRVVLRQVMARPLYRAAGLAMPPPDTRLLRASGEILPTLRPFGELAPYVGEVLEALRSGVDVVLNVGPNGCMVSTMCEVLTPRIIQSAGLEGGRIQSLFSAQGDVNEELLALAVLKAIGPERFCASGFRAAA